MIGLFFSVGLDKHSHRDACGRQRTLSKQTGKQKQHLPFSHLSTHPDVEAPHVVPMVADLRPSEEPDRSIDR
jgi:hypothetical protein